jgi:C-terminal processing protease CtpA/Prc
MMRALALACAVSIASAVAAEKGYIGLSVSIDADGIFHPTLKSAVVHDVAPGSPAAAAGLAKGDQLVEVEGRTVAGAKAEDLKPYLSRNAGEALRLKVRKPSGEVVDVTIVAAVRPRPAP